jgi:16S rRNA G527 N7-methylase RsmG
MKKKKILFLSMLIVLLMLISCAPSTKQVLATNESQVKLRAIQTRAFDTTDRDKMLRTVIATLQDLGFIVDKADNVLGAVSATKLDRYTLRMTVSVRPRGETQLLVRANAQYNITAVEDPEPYQQFFDALSKAIFLTAHQVD